MTMKKASVERVIRLATTVATKTAEYSDFDWRIFWSMVDQFRAGEDKRRNPAQEQQEVKAQPTPAMLARAEAKAAERKAQQQAALDAQHKQTYSDALYNAGAYADLKLALDNGEEWTVPYYAKMTDRVNYNDHRSYDGQLGRKYMPGIIFDMEKEPQRAEPTPEEVKKLRAAHAADMARFQFGEE